MDQAELIKVIEKAAREGASELDLRDKRITQLPEQIGLLVNLQDLDLSNNELSTLPEQIGQLVNLKWLRLYGNNLSTLPDQIGQLQNLQMLGLSKNKFSVVPEQVFQLVKLRTLHLDGNYLERLSRSISQLKQLENLDLGDMELKRGNPLVDLPIELWNLTNLKDFDLTYCPNLNLPPEIVAKTESPQEILRYFFESRDEKGRPLLELKLLLVGRGKGGKTTLVKRLAGEKPNENEPETHSISIRELTLGCPRGKVRTRIWDFGGQEILHSTHQFFLTERSLYLLVLEPRTGLAQRDAEYWLKLIETQGGGSPVIVIMNWSHGHRWRVDEVKLRRKFPFIVDFLQTDALYGEGIEDLRETIIQTVDKQMSNVWLPFPLRWREIKEEVAGMHENFLPYDKYTKLCIDKGENDPDAQADLAGILHALGLALYFGKDPQLHDTRVLNPRWVTGGVYALIRSPSVAENEGQLVVTDMPQVLREAQEKDIIKETDYPPETHGFILELMRAFQLCFASEEEKGLDGEPVKSVCYLVPELLPEFEPEMEESWEDAPVRLRYRYEVLPPGLLPRFIVRTHALSEGATHWRHGVVLRHGDASALIRAESDRPELYVFVLGGDEDTCRVMVTMVRRELEALHGEMKVKPVEELELTGEDEHWISVKALREVEEPQKPKQKLPIQPEGTAEVNVPLELDKLLPSEARAIDRDPAKALIPVRIFVSYAHDDERRLKRLDAILDVLEQHHGLTSWSDKRLIAGQEWDGEIRRRLEDMDIFLFIASQMSIIRPYIKDPELRRAKERHKAGEIEVVVVKLEPCACDEDPFLGKLQRLAPRYKSIIESKHRSAAWEQVRKDLLPVIKLVRKKKD